MTPERAAGQALLDELAAAQSGIERSPMFGSSGVRRAGQLFAFVGRAGALVVRLPADRAQELLAAGQAREVRMGRGTAREWVAVPLPDDGAEPWRGLLDEAHLHAVG